MLSRDIIKNICIPYASMSVSSFSFSREDLKYGNKLMPSAICILENLNCIAVHNLFLNVRSP